MLRISVISAASVGALEGAPTGIRAFAQTVAPSAITPPTLAPAPVTSRVRPLPLAPGSAPPANAETLRFHLRRLVVSGGVAELAEDEARLARPLEGQMVSVAQAFEFAAQLEQAYARKGFILVRVVVPPQKLAAAGPVDLEISVIDGFIESIEVKDVAEPARSLVAARTQALVGRRGLKLAEIERAILLAGDIPGVTLKSALARGEQLGASRLVLEGDQRFVSGSFGVDDTLPYSLGLWQASLSVSLNDVAGLGEQTYVTAGTGLAFGVYGFPRSPLDLIGVGVVVPIGVNGWSVNPEFTNSLTWPTPTPGAPASLGDFRRFALRSSYPLVRERAETFSLTGALEAVEQRLYARDFAAAASLDSYSAARVGFSWQRLSPWAAPFHIDLQVSQGLFGRGEAQAAATGVPLSRQGTTPNFSKLDADARLDQPLPGDFGLTVFGRMQDSWNHPVFLSEQFALDGPEALSPTAWGTFNVDSGATLRQELTLPRALKADLGGLSATPYVFAAQGWGYLYRPTAVEQGEVSGAAYGLGVRADRDAPDGRTGATLSLELGWLSTNNPEWRASTRVNVVGAFRF